MNKKIKLLLAAISLIVNCQLFAQESSDQFKQVDEYVKSLGSLDTLNMGTISYIITKKFPGAKDKTRAIFDWIAYNINYDCKAARSSGNEVTGSEEILKTRKAVAARDACGIKY